MKSSYAAVMPSSWTCCCSPPQEGKLAPLAASSGAYMQGSTRGSAFGAGGKGERPWCRAGAVVALPTDAGGCALWLQVEAARGVRPAVMPRRTGAFLGGGNMLLSRPRGPLALGARGSGAVSTGGSSKKPVGSFCATSTESDDSLRLSSVCKSICLRAGPPLGAGSTRPEPAPRAPDGGCRFKPLLGRALARGGGRLSPEALGAGPLFDVCSTADVTCPEAELCGVSSPSLSEYSTSIVQLAARSRAAVLSSSDEVKDKPAAVLSSSCYT
mmetsp:Transcript_33621/g.73785  ORF Transcript_33621/g.73785 Transcript_33621/m.73785 type:complete len:270 (-) Transcript_33621:104-913(-)